nr:MAG TPA: hypothetical protein [Caudoviricetes sp.]
MVMYYFSISISCVLRVYVIRLYVVAYIDNITAAIEGNAST